MDPGRSWGDCGNLVGMNWKTTVSGALAAIGTALAAPGVLPPPWGMIAQLMAALGLALLGSTAQDKARSVPSVSPKSLN